jgi:hypothetical protein
MFKVILATINVCLFILFIVFVVAGFTSPGYFAGAFISLIATVVLSFALEEQYRK